MARYHFAERGLLPWIIMSQTVPLIALAPQVVSWSGRIDIFGKQAFQLVFADHHDPLSFEWVDTPN